MDMGSECSIRRVSVARRGICVALASLFTAVLLCGMRGALPSRAALGDPACGSAQGCWQQSGPAGFGDAANTAIAVLAPFEGYLYAGTSHDDGAQLWRSADGLAWTPVLTNGFGLTRNVGIDHLWAFEGDLYAGTWADETAGGEVYRSPDGLAWTRVAERGFGDPTNAEVFCLAAFGNELYAATMSYTTTHGAEIWRSPNGNPHTWQQVLANGFGDAENGGLVTVKEFEG